MDPVISCWAGHIYIYTYEHRSIYTFMYAISVYIHIYIYRGQVFLEYFFCFFWCICSGNIGKSAGVTKMGLMAQLQTFFLVVLFVLCCLWQFRKNPPTTSSCLAASLPWLASRTTISGQIMGARQSVGLSGFRASRL